MNTNTIVIILLGCREFHIMEQRLNASLTYGYGKLIFLVSGTPEECQYYEELLSRYSSSTVYYDSKATDTLSNAEGIKMLIEEKKLQGLPLRCRLSMWHTWRFKKCCKMMKIKDICLSFSTFIDEAKGEWIPIILYIFGPIGIRFTSWITKRLR